MVGSVIAVKCIKDAGWTTGDEHQTLHLSEPGFGRRRINVEV